MDTVDFSETRCPLTTFVKNPYTEFHENTPDGLVADKIRSRTERGEHGRTVGETDVFTQGISFVRV
jgi:hypothetical protein